MARYIDVEPLEDKLKEHIKKTESELMLGALSTFLRVLDITPTADVAPVRHGRWVESYKSNAAPTLRSRWTCSWCGNVQTYGATDYCPNCGARMDGEEKNCGTCKHHDKWWDDIICDGCTKAHSNWERKDDE